MLVDVAGKSPKIHSSAMIAPSATIAGDVQIGKNVRVMYGAQVIAENSPITIEDNCIILENAVLRGVENFPLSISSHCLIGPNTHLAGCLIEERVFIATGVSIFHGAIIKTKSEIRINGVVHINSVLPKNTVVPINWVALGSPAQVLPSHKHHKIWEIQGKLEFNKKVYNIQSQKNILPAICKIMAVRLGQHLKKTRILK